ncbi:hypothetical protein BDBG_17020 [Blastomyces gilchristii SLH14081]|uniref:Uncharacterized protein n=1 Tax=Blastomyces gilchristii (strain SLH14081) TaxID=559298 RepID=A0A179UK48_BLAGS|nr:uncharacterized protein BDBG_17020 [Blastomyces gilchristii SLH14081]OAT08364.1 hypothetical protein BDBG_17020 [Blastomyces gilchristii SLH14081]
MQFLITLAYVITVHKSQGLSFNKIVLNIIKKNFAAGLTYVAVSQVKFYQELLFEKAFDYHRFRKDEFNTMKMRCLNTERHELQHFSSARHSLYNSLLSSFDDLYDADLNNYKDSRV